VTERRKFLKAVTTDLSGPHYGGLTYLPGTHHALGLNDPFDHDPDGWCTAGLYVTSHRRVAARWGPVVIEVLKDQGAPLVKTTQKHKPTGVPNGVDSGSYAKYRTTGFQVIRIIGIVGYGQTHQGSIYAAEQSKHHAKEQLYMLNQTLRRHGKESVSWTGESLERLRDDRYQLWEVLDPNALVRMVRQPSRVRHRVEFEFEADHQLTEAELFQHLLRLDGSYTGSHRIVSMR
jgi:hypothetical protein